MNQPQKPSNSRSRNQRGLAPVLALLILATALATPSLAATDADVASLLQQHRLQATKPSTASGFDLPNLAGGTTSLASLQGKWAVLTFFATWCGPCRSEMPSLEVLHQQFTGQDLVVLAISVDRNQSKVEPFIRNLGITFPILWDEGSRVGRAYRASSIPVSYVIDPAGRVVGVSRGARDWSALAPLMRSLLSLQPGEEGIASQAQGSAPAGEPEESQELVDILDPPIADIELSTSTPKLDQPFELAIKVQWSGDFAEYLLHPPKVALPEGILDEGTSATTSSLEDANVVHYRIKLRASQPGRFALDPVEVRFTPRGEETPMATRLQGPTVEVAAPKLLGMAPKTLALTGSGTLALGLLLFGVGRRLTNRQPMESELDGNISACNELLQLAKQSRIQGDGVASLAALVEIDTTLANAESDQDAAADPALAQELELAKFGGQSPRPERLDAMIRQAERRLAQLASDPSAKKRSQIELRDSEATPWTHTETRQ